MPTTIKDEVRALLDRLPDDVSWERLADVIELRRRIARGLEDIEAGRVTPNAKVFEDFRTPVCGPEPGR
jgi:predicted transcriptional regulator